MKTVLTTSATAAAAYLQAGQVVAFPTETVYGLGASVWSEAGLERIYEAKGRPSDNPLIVHLSRLEQASLVAGPPSPAAARLIERFFPGPLTLVLPKHPRLPARVTAGLETVAIRMPRHARAQEFLNACGVPVAAPSANRSGRPSPTTWEAVRDDLDGRIACILQGANTEVGLESTVVDCTDDPPVLLRAGAVSLEALQAVCPEVRGAHRGEESLRNSPGTRHRHYAPRARVVLVDAAGEVVADPSHAFIGLQRPVGILGHVQVVRDLAEYAHHLFAFFRACDHARMTVIYCQRTPREGIGRAVMDRLERAAAPT